jgi:hypothetical protein
MGSGAVLVGLVAAHKCCELKGSLQHFGEFF